MFDRLIREHHLTYMYIEFGGSSKEIGISYCVFFSYFPVCGIYRSAWICNCWSLDDMWACIYDLHSLLEEFQH